MTARVVCHLNVDGTPGKVLHAGKRTGKATYQCGGGHRFEVVVEEEQQDDD
jgi:hypothetical protein